MKKTKKEGWEFTGQYFGNCEIWKSGNERILYDPNKETWTNQYTIDQKPLKKRSKNEKL